MQAIIDFLTGIVTLGGHFDWGTVKQFLFDSTILQGTVVTLFLAVISQITGSIIGLILYLLRRSSLPVVRWFGEGYVWFFRGTPLLVQMFFLFNFFPIFGLVRPLRQSDFFPSLGLSSVLLELFLPAFIALSMNEGAYMAEIVRAGIDSIDPGQLEAAKSLGMPYGLAMRRIILPQAARVILPPLGNEFNSMLKTTSLAATLGLVELYKAGESLSTATARVLEIAVVLSAWYLLMTTLWGFVQQFIERRLNASNTDIPPNASLWQRLLGRQPSGSPSDLVKETLLSGGRR